MEDLLYTGENFVNIKEQKEFWTEYLNGAVSELDFPAFKKKYSNRAYKESIVNHFFGSEVFDNIKLISTRQEVDIFSVLIAVTNTLIYKYTKKNDILIGMIENHGDNKSSLEHYLPVRTLIEKNMPFSVFLKSQDENLNLIYNNKEFSSLNEIKKNLNITANVLISFNDFSNIENSNETSDIKFCFQESEKLELIIKYNSKLYDYRFINKIFGHFQQVISKIAYHSDLLIKEIDYITEEEKSELLNANQNNTLGYNQTITLLDLFKEKVVQNPDKIAAVYEKTTLTFKELDEKSNQLANYLLEQGIKKGENVLLCFNNEVKKSLIGILGIMKAGGVYVPVDSDAPVNRISYFVKDVKAKSVITNSNDSSVFTEVNIIYLDDKDASWNFNSNASVNAEIKPDDLAYIIYTSGSTGMPKGVLINHRNLIDYFTGLNSKIDLSENRSYALMSTISTDLGNTILFGSLINGATLHLFSKDRLRDPEYINNYFAENSIDCIKLTPFYWKSLEYNGNLLLPEKTIIFGGEALSAGIVDKIKNVKSELKVINHYGPTETTIGKLIHIVNDNRVYENNIPIGNPFSETLLYIVDEDLKLCAKGVWGELLIGGKGVFRGYLNLSSVYNERCIANPFEEAEGVLYKTGDLVRYNLEGEIEFGSRVDDQIKIQGYRVELNEITELINQYGFVNKSVVDYIENQDAERIIVSYIIKNQDFSEENFKEYLHQNLPAYMIPSMIIEVDHIPLMSNGKVDKRKLPKTNLSKVDSEVIESENEHQKAVVEILKEIFKKESISITDNFFELGGDSIKSIQLVSRLRQRGLLLNLKDIIKNPVLRDFANLLKLSTQATPKNNQVLGEMNLTPIQELFFRKKQGNYNHYNQSVILYSKEINADALEKAVESLMDYHDTLKIRFKQNSDKKWIQFYDEAAYNFIQDSYTDENDFEQKIKKYSTQLDIEKGPQIKVCLFKQNGQDRILFLVHHLLVDGVSFRILVEDLSNLYDGFLLNTKVKHYEKTSSFKEWQQSLSEYAVKNKSSEESGFWQEINDKNFDKLKRLPSGIYNTIGERKTLAFSIDKETTNDLITKCYKKYQTEINEVLITALLITLKTTFNLNKISLNLEGHGRENIDSNIDVSRTIGWFTSIFPVYFDLEDKEDNISVLLHIKNNLNVIPNKGIGYGIFKYLGEQKLDTEPEITFNYLGDFTSNNPENMYHDIKFNYQDASEDIQCNDLLNITGKIENSQMHVYINFNKFHFTEQEIEEVCNLYKNNLVSLVHQLI